MKRETGPFIYRLPSFSILTAKKEHFEDLKNLEEKTRKEPKSYKYFLELDKNKPNIFFSYQEWESVEDRDMHWKVLHFKKIFAYFDKHLAELLIFHHGHKD